MNKLMITAAAAALLLPMSAGAVNPEDKMADPGMKTEKQTETMTETLSDAKIPAANSMTMAKLSPGSLSAKDLLGEGVHGVNGDRIARVDDIVIDANGKADSVVFLSGGMFGLGGKRGALDYKAVDIGLEGDYEPAVSVSMSEESMKSVVEFKTTDMNDYSLVSELIGAKVNLKDFADDDDNAVISDVILASDGTVENLIVQESVIGSIGAGEKYAVAYSKLSVEQGDGGLILDLTQEELKASPQFKSVNASLKDNVMKTWDKTKEGVKDAGESLEDAVQ